MESISPSLGGIFGRRANVFFGAKELWYNYQIKNPIQIEIVLGKAKELMEIKLHETSKESYNVESYIETKDLATGKKFGQTTANYNKDLTLSSGISFGSGLFANLSRKVGNVLKNYSEQINFLDSSDRNDLSSIEKLLGRIKGEGYAKEFGKYLDSIFGKGERWEFIPHPENSDEFRVAFTNGVPKFITGMGDGIRYAMQIIATALMVKDTGILIEEIESNQHPASLQKLISFLIETAFRNNLQLFITTHNHSVLEYVYHHFKPEEKVDKRAEEVNFFHVQREDKTGIVKCEPRNIYHYEELKKVWTDIF
jgi:hypothetical protein